MKTYLMAIAASALALPAAPALAAELPAQSRTTTALAGPMTPMTMLGTASDAQLQRGDWRDQRRYNRGYREGRQAQRQAARERRLNRRDRVWRGDDGRYRCRRDDGTTGLVIGAGVGALAGSQIAGRGDATIGAIIGGLAGGLLGREVDRGELRCR